ncbi:hypothetical protein HNY73_009917 [Argiope bruennichi]|uniref:Uncharacterized protein n=1 Tax=Argiope bruennichi TaxID=94029 RepID=A0A8T0FB57_ARGBR|nr:hypothetical protein HNY73_009917 [Argiope bruennichi]
MQYSSVLFRRYLNESECFRCLDPLKKILKRSNFSIFPELSDWKRTTLYELGKESINPHRFSHVFLMRPVYAPYQEFLSCMNYSAHTWIPYLDDPTGDAFPGTWILFKKIERKGVCRAPAEGKNDGSPPRRRENAKILWVKIKSTFTGRAEDHEIDAGSEMKNLQMKSNESAYDYVAKARGMAAKCHSLGLNVTCRELVYYTVRELKGKFSKVQEILKPNETSQWI